MPGEIAFTVESGGDLGCINGTAPVAQVTQGSPIALLAGMPPSESRVVLSAATRFSFASNETILLEGDPANCLILIETGRVKLTRVGRDGSEVILRICGSGEVVDVYAERGYRHHTCTARAMTHCRVLIWDSKQAVAVGMLYPEIRTNLARILANRLNELEDRFCEIATGNCEQRLARTLLRLVEPIGRTNRDGTRVVLSRTELAQMIGVTIFTVCRTLSKWAETGIVSLRHNSIMVHRAGELKTLIDDAI
jgi:CRP-like cAMP-binding protein